MFIALGMAAEIIMVVQDQDFFICSMLLLKKVGSRESTKSATNNDQIVSLGQFAAWTPIRAPGLSACMCAIV